MKNFLSTCWRFLVRSSADPKRYSLAVKGFGLMLVTIYTAKVIPAINIVCEAGYLCELAAPEFVDALNIIVDAVSTLVYAGLLCFSALIAVVGTFRKLHRSFAGKNLVLRGED